MKSTFIIFALLLCINSIAQTISLPTYVEGQYENDIVYTMALKSSTFKASLSVIWLVELDGDNN